MGTPWRIWKDNIKKVNVARRVGRPDILPEVIREFPQFSRQIPRQFFKSGHDRFLPHPLQRIIAPPFDAML
jgi:hypothetical protein